MSVKAMPNQPLNVLLIGGGGREHALAWKLSLSPNCKHVFCAPGNGGTATTTNCSNVEIAVDDFSALIKFATQNQVDLTVVGPDNPLAAGIVDEFESAGLRIFGPGKEAARLEWSKAYAKEVMTRLNIPTARFAIAESYEQGRTIVENNDWARVIKADGLALGKGVFVCDNAEAAVAALAQIFQDKIFGESGNKVVIEERLTGEEVSLLTLCDGSTIMPLLPARDFKRRFDGDKGPNTGGMGSIAPIEFSSDTRKQIDLKILMPLRAALVDGSLAYRGVLYIGLMLVEGKDPYVIEFNARFGDPETQVLLPLLKSDLLSLLWSCTEGTLEQQTISWENSCACCVVASATSYPEHGSKGEQISTGKRAENSQVFFAGAVYKDGKLLTNGGRVLCVTATGPNLQQACLAAYDAVALVDFKDMDYRKDIGISSISVYADGVGRK
jgi:phosphoribosylamine---glycine ligase